MTRMQVQLRSIGGTGAALGWAGAHTLVVDRAEGRAGGTGLGFNGGELLALAIGGCLCNDLHYVAQAMGIAIESIGVDVELTLEGAPLLATRALVRVEVVPVDPASDIVALIERARQDSTVSNSVARGIAVDFLTA
ncbi:organic hydroperoxide reductase OsmC/OhrA [Angulomicrobium tetraedrale]|uniref:Organic hydroperoxide reductase OsmC/OhrA n=1 Tax=Ancylobacter tetraedralis TaxID=217068 RepID=A0A839Z5A8_9HYPH|nr:OsmC family protein [Ancylobacter tetraedralis]MBB3770842.1 organic hydroperoxide reductase OsmC/OhrA [Ancylobacter tetraedralis]